MYPCSHCVIFHGLAILQLKTNGNPAKWAPSAIKEALCISDFRFTNSDFKSAIVFDRHFNNISFMLY
ncbi:MAG: hypothetical protein A2168_05080 [Planctomycetes bacterium RBG_13_50_24]|nr:MAG: hypothetical protein A2168_05080 [Planctomycetes bacterium RBG_13_50_24]